MGKGSSYEREVCHALSSWWTGGERSDVFWRSSNSGGRATVRAKKGKSTSGSYGDIAAIDASGVPLMKFVTIELKRGYSSQSFADLLDSLEGRKPGLLEHFIEQAMRSAMAAGSISWLLVHRRDKKREMAILPWSLVQTLRNLGAFQDSKALGPYGRLNVELKSGVCLRVGIFRFKELLAQFNSSHVLAALQEAADEA